METTQEIEDNRIVERIITTFKNLALSDIKFNKERPIAAAILCACLLDQISLFFYKERNNYCNVKKFIEKYMPLYNDIDLYDILRNPMVHNYSIKKGYSVSSDPMLYQYGLSMLSNGVLFIPSLISDLELAIDRAVKDLQEDKNIKTYAINWEKRHSLLEQNQIELAIYTAPEIERLKSEYPDLIKQHKIFSPESIEPVNFSIIAQPLPNGSFDAFIEIKELYGEKKTFTYPLHFLMQVLSIKSPMEFLQS